MSDDGSSFDVGIIPMFLERVAGVVLQPSEWVDIVESALSQMRPRGRGVKRATVSSSSVSVRVDDSQSQSLGAASDQDQAKRRMSFHPLEPETPDTEASDMPSNTAVRSSLASASVSPAATPTHSECFGTHSERDSDAQSQRIEQLETELRECRQDPGLDSWCVGLLNF